MRVISNFDNRGDKCTERRVLVNRSEEDYVAELNPNLEVLIKVPFVLVSVRFVRRLLAQVRKVLIQILSRLIFFYQSTKSFNTSVCLTLIVTKNIPAHSQKPFLSSLLIYHEWYNAFENFNENLRNCHRRYHGTPEHFQVLVNEREQVQDEEVVDEFEHE